MSEDNKKIPIKIKLKTPTKDVVGQPSSPKPKIKVEVKTQNPGTQGSDDNDAPYAKNPYQGQHSGGYTGNRSFDQGGQGGGNRPYQGGQGGGNRPYQGGQGGGNRPYQGGQGGGNRPYQGGQGGGGNRPYQGGQGGGNRPYQGGQGGGNRPYQGGQGGGNRPYQGGQGGGGNRPYQGGQGGGGNRPYQGGQGGGNRPYQGGQGGGGNRPYQGGQGGGGNRPYQGGQGGGNRPYQGGQGGGNRPYQGGQGGGGNRPRFGSQGRGGTTSQENSKKDFLSVGNKPRTVRTDFKKKKDFTTAYTDKEVSFELNRKKRSSSAAIPSEITIYDTILVSELAAKMNLKVSDLVTKLLDMGYIATMNDALDAETAEIVASEFGCKVHVKSYKEELNKILKSLGSHTDKTIIRPPIVTIMGHVDHGKTTLLDYIRKTHVADKEAGGITQHIGAYQVNHQEHKITFIDTPGHEAFTTMRSRGASITDIVILVVAADDGIMPQTIEALNHAKAANIPTIVAINKIDKGDKNLESIKSQLSEHGLIPEEWGGDTLYVGVSALTGAGVSELLDAILLNAEIKSYKAHLDGFARGVILEAKMDKSRGSLATVIVQDGVLKKGDIFVSGVNISRVRAMFDASGQDINEAPPSTPVEVLGFEDVPEAGDTLFVTPDEKIAKSIVDKRREIRLLEHAKKITKTDQSSLDILFQKIQEQGKADFTVVVKADVQGTVEAIKGMLEKLSSQIQEINLKVIHAAVGAITENDILLASTSGALVVGFNVRVNNDKTNRLARDKHIEIRRYSVIYEITADIQNAIEGILQPEQQEKIVGEATVRQLFKIPKIGFIAGCYVTEGLIKIGAQVRVIRAGVVEFTGKISTLKRFKEDVKEVAKGFECGIEIANFKGIREEDTIECFEIVQTSKKLKLVTPGESEGS